MNDLSADGKTAPQGAMIGDERSPAQDYVDEIAWIGIEKAEGKLKVYSASLWDEGHNRDFPGTLEGMEGETYDNEEEVKDAVEQIVSDLDIRQTIEVRFFTW